MTCARCGVEHLTRHGTIACKGHAQAAEGRACRREPMPGQAVCRYHGGMAPQNLKAGEKRQQHQEVIKAVNRYALEVVTTPEQTLQRALWRARGVVECLTEIVERIPAADLVKSEARKLLDERMKYATDLAAEMVRLNIEEKHSQVEQAQAVILVGVLRRVVDALGLPPDVRVQADAVVLRELQALDRQ